MNVMFNNKINKSLNNKKAYLKPTTDNANKHNNMVGDFFIQTFFIYFK